MKDWKGNEVQVGDTVIHVRVKPLFTQAGWFIPDEEGKGEIVMLPINPYVWQEIVSYKIVQYGEALFASFTSTDGTNYNTKLSKPKMPPEKEDDSSIICIKGKSDNEEEYYTEFFKAELPKVLNNE